MPRFARTLLAAAFVAAGLLVPAGAGAAPQPLQVPLISLPYGHVDIKYPAVQIRATGGTRPYTWSVVGGAFPTGMKLSASGVLSGTPNAPGVYDVQLRVTDKNHLVAERPTELVIRPMEILTDLKNGKKGQFYAVTMKSTGGCARPQWSTNYAQSPGSSGNNGTGVLQAGLKLSTGGVLSGVPKVSGTVSFTIWAICPGSPFVGDFVHRDYTLTVA